MRASTFSTGTTACVLALVALMSTAPPAAVALPQGLSSTVLHQCTGNTAVCPNSKNGVSAAYLQCNSWTQMYELIGCPTGQVCYANPRTPGSVICAAPGSGGVLKA